MKNKNTTILIVVSVIALSVFIYTQLKKRKSFLKLSDAEKEKFILDEEKKIWDIRNNPNLTQKEKDDAIDKIAKEKEKNYTEEEKKAIAEIWVKELQTGNIKLNLTPSDKGVFPNIQTGVSTVDMPKTDYSNLSNLGLANIDFSKIDWSKVKK
jgi:hypothetical protein